MALYFHVTAGGCTVIRFARYIILKARRSCQEINDIEPDSPSGVYVIRANSVSGSIQGLL